MALYYVLDFVRNKIHSYGFSSDHRNVLPFARILNSYILGTIKLISSLMLIIYIPQILLTHPLLIN